MTNEKETKDRLKEQYQHLMVQADICYGKIREIELNDSKKRLEEISGRAYIIREEKSIVREIDKDDQEFVTRRYVIATSIYFSRYYNIGSVSIGITVNSDDVIVSASIEYSKEGKGLSVVFYPDSTHEPHLRELSQDEKTALFAKVSSVLQLDPYLL